MRQVLSHKIRCFFKTWKGILLVCWLVIVLALPTFAQTARSVTWEDLATPSNVSLDNPYQHLTEQQLYDLAYLVRRQETSPEIIELTPQATEKAKRIEQNLQSQGLDVDKLLAQVELARDYYAHVEQATNAELEGQEISLQGFLLPLDTQFGNLASEFLLVPYVGACIHTPQPPANQIVYLKLPKSIKAPQFFSRVSTTGRLEARHANYDLFLLDGTESVAVSYALTEPTIALKSANLPDGSMPPELGAGDISWQAKASNYLTHMLTQMRDRPSPRLFGLGLLVAFSYGVLHTLGPGHSKTVIASYFIGEGGSLSRGILMGIRIAILHVLSAVIGVVLLNAILQQTIQDSATHYRVIRIISYGAIALIGAIMLQRSLRKIFFKPVLQTREQASANLLYPTLTDSLALNANAELASRSLVTATQTHYPPQKRPQQLTLDACNCLSCWQPSRRQSQQARKLNSWLTVAIGAVPCSGAVLILLFGLGNNFLWPSIVLVMAISMGMAVTLAGIGVMAIWGRTLIDRRFVHQRRKSQQFAQYLQAITSGSILIIGLSFLSYTLMA